jgi:hypothetical protein
VTLYEIVYGPRAAEGAGLVTVLERALEANVVMARGYALAGDRVNEAARHREINQLLDLREREGGAA